MSKEEPGIPLPAKQKTAPELPDASEKNSIEATYVQQKLSFPIYSQATFIY
jgi:hypothetical protein